MPMAETNRVTVAHFTNIAHLVTIVSDGLLSDDQAKESGRLLVDVGDHAVKNLRTMRIVPVPPGGAVSSYVPFYFAKRSPMLYKIWKGEVRTYADGQEPLIYLVTSLERLVDAGCQIVVTDGNAANAPTTFSSNVEDVETLVDYEVLTATMWNNTSQDPDRMRRRMAECLVKDQVPFSVFERIVTLTDAVGNATRSILASMGMDLPVSTQPGWYYP